MNCSAIKKKYGRSGEKKRPQTCLNEATVFLTVLELKEFDKPYCEHCAYWIKEMAKRFGFNLKMININKN